MAPRGRHERPCRAGPGRIRRCARAPTGDSMGAEPPDAGDRRPQHPVPGRPAGRAQLRDGHVRAHTRRGAGRPGAHPGRDAQGPGERAEGLAGGGLRQHGPGRRRRRLPPDPDRGAGRGQRGGRPEPHRDGQHRRARRPHAHLLALAMPSRRALLIGVPTYKPPITSLEFVRDDIARLQEALATSGYGVETLGVDGEEAGLNTVRASIDDFLLSAQTDETLLITFSGHGMHYQGQDYLIPADAVLTRDDRITTYSLAVDFSRPIEESRAGAVLFFIDACREGVSLGTMARSG